MITKQLEKRGLWADIRTALYVRRRWLWQRMVCKHADTTEYVYVDHRSNPPPYQDVYEGTVCTHCGAVLTRKQTF